MYDTYKKKLLNGEKWKQKSKGHGPQPHISIKHCPDVCVCLHSYLGLFDCFLHDTHGTESLSGGK